MAGDLEALAAQLRELHDIEAVRVLMARYHRACDGTEATGTHRDPEEIAALFLPDGVWNVPGGAVVGREAIVALARRLQSIAAIVHVAINPIVEIDGDIARAEFKGFVRACATPGAAAVLSVGRYDVVAARTPEGWRFRSLGWDYLEAPATTAATVRLRDPAPA